MKIQEVSILKIKPDKTQPRKTFDTKRIEDMAKSIVTEGVINPIEIDKSYTIITGEMRYRAAKLIGLATVPCKIINIKPSERFRRQVVENIHHNTMNDYDTAKALQKLINFVPRTKSQGRDAGISHLATEIGKSEGYIRQHLDILSDSKSVQKALKEGKISFTHARDLRIALPEHRKAIERKMLKGEFKKGNSLGEVVRAISRNPDKAKELLAIDYSKYQDTAQVVEVVSKISPRLSDEVRLALTPPQELAKIKNDLLSWLKRNPPHKIINLNVPQILFTFDVIAKSVNKWSKSIK